MAAPEHVPSDPMTVVRSYTSPPRRPSSWRADRPGDFAGASRQPRGDALGSQGPDQGYALGLAHLVEPDLVLSPGEHARDALAGIVAVGLKRASLLGRAPMIEDLWVAATVFGFLDPDADPELVALRQGLFEEVGHFHHYMELRHIADMVDPEMLRLPLDDVRRHHQVGWRDLFDR